MPGNRRRRLRLEIPPPEALRSIAPLAKRAPQTRPAAPETQPTPLAQGRQGNASGVMGGILGGIATQPKQPPAAGRSFALPTASAGEPVTALAVDRLQATFSAPVLCPAISPSSRWPRAATRGSPSTPKTTSSSAMTRAETGRPFPRHGRAAQSAVALTSAVSFGSAAPALKISSRPSGTAGLNVVRHHHRPCRRCDSRRNSDRHQLRRRARRQRDNRQPRPISHGRSGARQLSDRSPGKGFRKAVVRHRGGALTPSCG